MEPVAAPDDLAERRRQVAFAVVLAVLLAVYNNLGPGDRTGLPHGYLVVNLVATALVLVAARGTGLTWGELGLGRREFRVGLRWGGVALLLVGAVYLALLAGPLTRPLLTDARVAGLDGGDLVYDALLRIPLGTVVWEEVAFRGVLLAALARAMALRWAVAASAVVFGVWHVRPTISALAGNDLADGIGAPLHVAVALACLAMALAGVVLAWLRLRSGSLLAPLLLHLATNSLGVLAAAAAHRMG